jgi:RNA polymerase sigma-70 factor (ECF subfamily)
VEASWSDELERAARETAKEAVARRPELAEVFDAHAPFVARALRCLGVHDGELADACQEVFLVVHRRLAGFEGRSSLRTWLYAICVRQAFRVRRRTARRREEPMAEPPVPAAADGETPQEELERRRALASALRILDRLEEGKRVVFVLYEVEQLPMAEIAEAIGCPLQTAYSRLYAARREVARALKKRGER